MTIGAYAAKRGRAGTRSGGWGGSREARSYRAPVPNRCVESLTTPSGAETPPDSGYVTLTPTVAFASKVDVVLVASLAQTLTYTVPTAAPVLFQSKVAFVE